MAVRGDRRRIARSVKAEFDDSFGATASGGAVLYEQVMRRLGIRKLLGQHLPSRPESCEYDAVEIGYAVLAGLLCGGRGNQCAEVLRKDALLARIFGLEGRVAEEATVWRALCDMAGLEQRKLSQAYVPAGVQLASMDMFGAEHKAPRLHRVVPQEPEAMKPENKDQMDRLLAAVALRCCQALNVQSLMTGQFFCYHGDATDLEVRGQCFDAAHINHEGELSLRLQTVKIGPVYCAEQLLPGASDEGLNLPALLKRAHESVISRICGFREILALLDAAYCEKQVVETLLDLHHYYLICANQWRAALTGMAEQLEEHDWSATGPDSSRGWTQSDVAVFTHLPEGWSQPQIVIARRWRVNGELSLAWHYSFLYTNIRPEVLSKAKRSRYGYAPYLWMLYGSKQGHENYYKPRLSDLGGHHPSSGRLGAAQVLSALIGIAANLHGVISCKVIGAPDRGIRLWRFVRDYVSIAATVVMRAGQVLVVRLAGAHLSPDRKRQWLEAYACAGRL